MEIAHKVESHFLRCWSLLLAALPLLKRLSWVIDSVGLQWHDSGAMCSLSYLKYIIQSLSGLRHWLSKSKEHTWLVCQTTGTMAAATMVRSNLIHESFGILLERSVTLKTKCPFLRWWSSEINVLSRVGFEDPERWFIEDLLYVMQRNRQPGHNIRGVKIVCFKAKEVLEPGK